MHQILMQVSFVLIMQSARLESLLGGPEFVDAFAPKLWQLKAFEEALNNQQAHDV